MGRRTNKRRQLNLDSMRVVTEQLEGRTFFSITWAGGAGEWDVASSWVGGVVPGQLDAVVIPAGSTVNITRSSTNGTYTANSDTLTVAAGVTINVESGDVLGSNDGGTIAGTLNLGGELDNDAFNNAQLVLSGTTTVSATGVLASNHQGLVTNTGTIAFVNGGGLNGGTFTNAAAATITGGIALGENGIFVNAAGGTTTLTDDSGFTPDPVAGGGFGTFINRGTFVKSGGTGTSNFPDYPGITSPTIGSVGLFESLAGGTVDINSGNFAVHGHLELGDTTLNIATNSTFRNAVSPGDSNGAYAVAVVGTVTGTGGGTVAFDQGIFSARSADDSSAAATAVLNFPVGMAQIGGASFEQFGGVTITNTGFLDFPGSTAHGEVTLINSGTIRNTGTADIPLAVVTNSATGLIDLRTDAGLSSATANALNLTNSGIVRKSAGTGTSVIGASLSDTGGTIDVEAGTVDLGTTSRTLLTNPVVTVATGATLALTTTGVNYVQGTLAATGGGVVKLTAGEISGPRADAGQDDTNPGTLAFATGVFSVSGGVIDGNNFPIVNTGTIAYVGANTIDSITNRGTMTIDAGPVNFAESFLNDTGGTINFTADQTVTGTANGFLTNNGTIIKSAGAGTLSLAGYAVTNAGTIEVASGTMLLDGGNRGFLDYQGGSDYDLAAGQTLKVDAGATLDIDSPRPVISNSATVILGGAGATIPFLSAMETNTGTFEVLSGASFTTAGALSGTGTLTVGGQVTVAGALSQTGTLGFDIAAAPGAAGAPLLTVAGATTLAGTLQVTVEPDITVTSGTKYTVATFAAPAAGSFASTNAGDFTPTVSTSGIILNATGNVGPTPTGTLVPTVTRSTVPTNVVGTIRHAGKVTVSIANTTAAVSSGKDTFVLYATTTGAIDSSSIVLATIVKKLAFKANQAKLFTFGVQTQKLPAGSYTLLVQTTDPTGSKTTAATGPSLVVQAPVVTLSATVSPISPVIPRAGRKASFIVSLTNTGNIDSTAPLAITFGLGTDGSTTIVVPIRTARYKAHIKANGRPVKLKLSFTLPKGLIDPAFYTVVTIAGTVSVPATNSLSAVGPAFTISA